MKAGAELVFEPVAHSALVLPVDEERDGLLHHLHEGFGGFFGVLHGRGNLAVVPGSSRGSDVRGIRRGNRRLFPSAYARRRFMRSQNVPWEQIQAQLGHKMPGETEKYACYARDSRRKHGGHRAVL